MYNVNYNGEYIELPCYSFELAADIERISQINQSSKPFKEKCNAMYCFNAKVLTADKQNELIGRFDQADPNDINILFLSIVEAYSKPVNDFNGSKVSEALNDDVVSKLSQIAKSLEALEKIK